MTKPKRKIIRRHARKSSKKAWPLSSLVANWLGDPGLAWRALLPFVLIASLIAIGAGALFSYRSASGDTRSRRDVATIVFVEADVPPRATEPGEKDQDACGAAKTGAVWKEAENLLEAYWKRAVRAQDGAKWSLWMYALNGAPGAGNELLRIGPHELGDV